jgi:dGTPase
MRLLLQHPIAAYAAHAALSRGRLFGEPASPTRSDFQRDRDRIIHSTAFRRLAHKTQVFVAQEGDHYRTRLTHTIEVAQIARALARALGLDEDLAEAVSLAHDLGHTPFGHTGEEALNACMAAEGGFDHNAQALRIVTELERRYADFDGLNLTWETLEGLVKHNGPLLDDRGRPKPHYRRAGIPDPILAYDRRHRLDLSSFASAEAQVAAIADDIAYNSHDLDDGLRAKLFDVPAVRSLPLLARLMDDIDRRHPGLPPLRVIHELIRRAITCFVEDVIDESRARLAATMPRSAADIRAMGRPVIGFSAEMAAAEQALKAFLHRHMYRHPVVMRVRGAADRIVRALFCAFTEAPSRMPEEWALTAQQADRRGRIHLVCDYIAGMTDRYAIAEHRRLFDETPELR